MAKQTLEQRYIAALQGMGYTIVRDGSYKYTLLHKEGSSPAYVWVGSAGAVRCNTVKRVDGSRPLGPKSKAKLLARLETPAATPAP